MAIEQKWLFEVHETREDSEAPEFIAYVTAKCPICGHLWHNGHNIAEVRTHFYWDHDMRIQIPEFEIDKARQEVKQRVLNVKMPPYCEYCGTKLSDLRE